VFKQAIEGVDDDLRPNCVCILDQCLIMRHRHTCDTVVIRDHALLHFFVYLLLLLDSVPTYQVDLAKYFRDYPVA